MPTNARPGAPKPLRMKLVESRPSREHWYHYLLFFILFAAPLIAIHFALLNLPFFWDEQGQFVPTALDLLRRGLWVAKSTVPNVHPPGVEVYLVLFYKLFGYSIVVTRVAMLLLASLGLLAVFLLAIELSKGTGGSPAFVPLLFLTASPLFYMQSMMAQLDMPAMVFTMLALVLFLKRRYAWAAAASVVLVMAKETGIVAPLVFFVILAARRNFKHAALFAMPAVALAGWLVLLHSQTGYWLGDPGFAHYNVGYSLHPVRMALSLARRTYYLFFAEFRWIGTLVIVHALSKRTVFGKFAWQVTAAVSLLTFVLVSVLGGAELERYLLPVLAIFYIAVGVAVTYTRKWAGAVTTVALAGGLIVNLFLNPPYPFPYENNLAMVDFVRLQQSAAVYVEEQFTNNAIATAWPYSAALRTPDYGYTKRKLRVVETNDFYLSSIQALPPQSFDVLVTYTRTWAPQDGILRFSVVRRFLSHFYQWQPDITREECRNLGLRQVANWHLGGQEISIYVREIKPATHEISLSLSAVRTPGPRRRRG